MSLARVFDVLVILCVLVASSRALEGNATSSACDIVEEETIVTINCTRRTIDRITDAWPEEVSKIPKDVHVFITFYNNSITNITKLPKVPGSHQVAVNFKNNQVVDIVPGAFSDLTFLTFVDLTNNLLTGEVLRSEIFQGPYDGAGEYGNIALESLYLSHNEIHSLDRYLFQYTPNLTVLWLNYNPIEILDQVTLMAISSAVNLKFLDLSYTGIDSIPYEAFKGLTNLNQIDLSGNKFVTVPESLRLVGNSLEVLTFNNNPIVELNDDSFNDLTHLIQLEVGDNDYLEEVKRSTFSPLKSLRTLHLCHNRRLRYISHNAFRGLKDQWTLTEVHLDDNNLSELSSDLMPWSKLVLLGMSGNNWLCNCDLANIVTKQGAGQKFKEDEIPYCAAPIKLSGQYITNITLTFCPTFDDTFNRKKGFSMSDLKPKHVLWSIFGVATVVGLGMVIGLLVNGIKAYIKRMRSQPIHYINLNEDSSFA
ncbi:chondroadherin-like isoform X1 [Pectinophora gossypiella]|uniref:chondroadherin-like isoform X1 n=1 Tax=Pectinophora gossypiella TaxID=13191 RepID=UPI00214EED04|nr:chondroadherin-like isoform X1 [Pectinophora gossypiella]